MSAGWIKAAPARKVKERFGLGIKLNGLSIALFRHGGKVYALKNRCSHQGAPIHDGYVKEGYAVCPHHQWQFRLSDGAFINNEHIKLPTYPVREEDGIIYILLDNNRNEE
ncbi:MAG TPA: Rieske (2Fe-2S) protein [Caldithrix abyssi]|uniref:Rieske (2Fe-2S) protein n=1 Tax=Caldithrix abyssi TaxID=187145 RepID=A0A7V4TZ24_CALAY|nr:Rieske (2Fe-2S) protein [Caldithrix abyssi]